MSDQAAIIDFDNAEQRKFFMGWMKSLKGQFRVSVKRISKARSLNANAYMWGCVYPAVARGLEEAWGESLTVEEVHEWLKARFLSRLIVNRKTGEIVAKRPGSTASLDSKEFADYLDKVIQFAAEKLGVEVPLPTTHQPV